MGLPNDSVIDKDRRMKKVRHVFPLIEHVLYS